MHAFCGKLLCEVVVRLRLKNKSLSTTKVTCSAWIYTCAGRLAEKNVFSSCRPDFPPISQVDTFCLLHHRADLGLIFFAFFASHGLFF